MKRFLGAKYLPNWALKSCPNNRIAAFRRGKGGKPFVKLKL